MAFEVDGGKKKKEANAVLAVFFFLQLFDEAAQERDEKGRSQAIDARFPPKWTQIASLSYESG